VADVDELDHAVTVQFSGNGESQYLTMR